jgi:aryl-alcohol dehydrogenase-like predicted oxidoreductase
MNSSSVSLPIPTRPLGKTGHNVKLLSLGGEGALRTHGRMSEAVAVIHRALELGVNYCDTAPAYSSSMDYYGAALGERRGQIFLASKTADRTRDGSLRILDESLRRLRTDHLDLWQLHDLRTTSELDAIFSKRGAIHALTEAREQGRVRFLGLTGHHDPTVLLEAMRRFDFDTVLVALNVADVHRLSFARSVLPDAARRGMGIIGMKVFGAGTLVGPGGICTPPEAMSYVLSLPGVSTVIIGCRTPAEVEINVRAACEFRPLSDESMATLEQRGRPREAEFTSYKRAG